MGVATSLQKVGICNISPRRCNQFQLENRGSGGEATVTYPVSVHLKDIDSGKIRFLEQVIQLEVVAEGRPLDIEGDCVAFG